MLGAARGSARPNLCGEAMAPLPDVTAFLEGLFRQQGEDKARYAETLSSARAALSGVRRCGFDVAHEPMI